MGLLQELDSGNVKSRISSYTDDVVLFIKPFEDDLTCTKIILDCFVEASCPTYTKVVPSLLDVSGRLSMTAIMFYNVMGLPSLVPI